MLPLASASGLVVIGAAIAIALILLAVAMRINDRQEAEDRREHNRR
jgi:hypothetical protein